MQNLSFSDGSQIQYPSQSESMVRIFLFTLVCGVAAELLTMAVVYFLDPVINSFQEVVLDMLLTFMIVFPVVFACFARPLQREMRARHKVIDLLKKSQADLENQVDLRTQQLGQANRTLIQENTQRKEAELALSQANASLQERERHLRMFISQIPAILWSTDTKLVMTTTVGAGLATLSLPEGSLNGQVLDSLPAVKEQKGPFIESHLRALKGEEAAFECIWGEKTYQCYVEPFFGAQGEIIGTVGLSMDVSEQERTANQIRLQSSALEASANGIIITDNTGVILFCNRAFELMTGYRQEEVLGRTPSFLKSGHHSEDFYQEIWQTLRAGQVWRGEIVNRRKTGDTFQEEQTITPVFNASREVTHFIAVKQDITERKQAEDAIRKHNQELSALYQTENQARRVAETLRLACSALPQSLNLDHTVETLLDYMIQLIPFNRSYVLLLEDENFLRIHSKRALDQPPGERPIFEMAQHPVLSQAFEQGDSIVIQDLSESSQWDEILPSPPAGCLLIVPLLAGGNTVGLFLGQKDESGFISQDLIQLTEALARQAAVGIQNAWLFEQVRAGQERFQNLSRRLVEIQEMERKYIARELHDEAGQALASISLELDRLERNVNHPEIVVRTIADLHQSLQAVLDGLHRVALDLRPASLDHLGLPVTLQQHVKVFGEKHGLRTNFGVIGLSERLESQLEVTLYRITQEALTNVALHAGATQVDVILETRTVGGEKRILLLIEDDGKGFDLEQTSSNERLGLMGMRERAEMLGGKLIVETRPENGTTILVDAPYRLQALDPAYAFV